LLPICSGCFEVRRDDLYWSRVWAYVVKHGNKKSSESLCAFCAASR
jgi:hypothetical protein